jgi:hypothetical protein
MQAGALQVRANAPDSPVLMYKSGWKTQLLLSLLPALRDFKHSQHCRLLASRPEAELKCWSARGQSMNLSERHSTARQLTIGTCSRLGSLDVQASQGWRPRLPSSLSPALRDIVTNCWHQDPRLRWSAAEAAQAIMGIQSKGASDCVSCVQSRLAGCLCVG